MFLKSYSRTSVSPGFTPRPSLSALRALRPDPPRDRVAGVHAPAFVERLSQFTKRYLKMCRVAGVHAPAFVERTTALI